MVLSIEGQGRLMTRQPPSYAPTGLPSRVIMPASTRGEGLVAEPRLVGLAPGVGGIMIAHVSVCHNECAIGHRSLPIISRYHIHASGLIGSPTVPSSRRLERSCLSGQCSPHLMKARIAVGAV